MQKGECSNVWAYLVAALVVTSLESLVLVIDSKERGSSSSLRSFPPTICGLGHLYLCDHRA